MPKPSQCMGPALQRQSEATHHHSQLTPSFLQNDICGYLSTGATSYRQPLSIRYLISTTHFVHFVSISHFDQIDYDIDDDEMQVLRYQTHHAAKQRPSQEGCVCQTPNYATTEMTMFSGMHFIHRMQLMFSQPTTSLTLCFQTPRIN